jgi:hypothetical protein
MFLIISFIIIIMISFATKKEIMSTMIQFEDKLVPYEVFVKDLARELTAQTCEALRLNNNIVSQNQAFKQFGAGNVRRWVKEGLLTPISKRPGKIEYNVFDLKRLKERQQDYFI